ncbi:hypothetical protein LSH36_838g01011 [Paralvinella palmiformis]|uniref:Vesicle transport protein n=1 Tax=Paralvinella palmiformis TaxID=53620 RepID=A0AAD9MUI3_9ANNE|nr:hypothetical protein LSH36_838g01011 [Paralvinella palmiformis]
MASINISNSLQEYLSKSDKSDSNSSLESSTKNGYFSWFSKNKGSKSKGEVIDETSNGWFSEAQKDPLLPSLSKQQRVIGFITCLLLGTFCMSLAGLYVPFLLLKARKFALLYTLGSLFIISSFALLWGPTNHMKHLLSAQRLPFTTAYFGSMFATLYFSMWLRSTIFTVLFAVLQILALVWYIVSYIPGGQTGLRFFSKVFYSAATKTVQKTLPV